MSLSRPGPALPARLELSRLHGALQVGDLVFIRIGRLPFRQISPRRFCSRDVREVLEEATGQRVGEAQSLAELLRQHPQARLGFWRCWYLGRIPWHRRTVTPASVLQSPLLRVLADGAVA